MEKNILRVDYDERADEIIDNISTMLNELYGIEIVLIDEERDGFDLYEIKKTDI